MCNAWRTLSMAYFLKKKNEMTDFIFPSMRVFILRKLRTLDIKVFVKSGSLMLLSNRV